MGAGASARTGSVLGRLLDVAAANAAATAVVDGTVVVSYGELVNVARRVADRIPAEAGRLIGIRMGRGWSAIAAMIGVMLSGRAYVPVDPYYPEPRQRYIEADARLSHVVTGDSGELRVMPAGDRSGPGHDVGADAMYVIYTSGSTGSPKGVVVTQRNLTSLLDAAAATLPLRRGQRWSVFHSLSFDFSVWEIWGPLLSAGCAVLVDRESAIDPQLTCDLLARARVNVLSMVPSAFTGLVRAAVRSRVMLPDLTCVVFGGEAVRVGDVVEWWRAGIAPDCALINMYGITETTVHVTQCRLTPDLVAAAEPGRTPIGVALPNAQVRISRDHGATTCPDGEAGEMIVSGAGVADGYLGRPDLSAARFPLLDGQRCYLSGDWGIRCRDGTLCYVGRVDDQVKIRGHRIELGEVEGVLARHDDVAAAGCVVHREAGRPDRLVAYVVGRDGAPDVREVRRWMSGQAPAHLVPTRIVALDDLPTTGSGKVDRKALAKVAADLFATLA